ncbi:MAG: CvpA family protein [Methylobacillus sp.]|jgi:membrane protein required for colicin V production|nr:CvpA family protein [Methylobacillus sp.]
MTVFDYGVIAILAVSVLLSMMRGFVRETLSLAAWVIAFFVAKWYAPALATLFPQSLTDEPLRILAAFLALFLATLLAVSLLAMAISEVFKIARLGGLDKLLGAAFGLARGALFVVMIVLLGGLTAVPQEPFWRDAVLSKPLETAVTDALPWLPEEFAKHVKYD